MQLGNMSFFARSIELAQNMEAQISPDQVPHQGAHWLRTGILLAPFLPETKCYPTAPVPTVLSVCSDGYYQPTFILYSLPNKTLKPC